MEPNEREIAISKVAYLLGEISDVKPVDPVEYGSGMHPSVYNKRLSQESCDKMVAALCDHCQKLDAMGLLRNHSLEMQMWWRDHQEADRRRIEEELGKEKIAARQAALDKLTHYEKKLLGL